MPRLDGKVALITGGASGMGAAEARRFVEEGARVIIADVAQEEGQIVCRTLGSAAHFEHLDVRDATAWRRAVAASQDMFGAIDVLVNNAGVVALGGVSEMTEEVFRMLIDVNTVGVFLGMQAVVPGMRSRGGSIVNISSISGMIGNGRSVGYTASKWAVRGMTKAAAVELAPYGIRVNSVHPGVIRTPMVAAVADQTSGIPPLGRVGEPHEVANLAVYLASDESRFTTGAEHVVDGGATAGW
jgi:3alpha(or 20beta)-hydroxysteroid dehydrogenase